MRFHKYNESILEVIFAINIAVNFFTEYSYFTPNGETKPVRNLGKIFVYYMNTSFWGDFIPTIPLYPLTY